MILVHQHGHQTVPSWCLTTNTVMITSIYIVSIKAMPTRWFVIWNKTYQNVLWLVVQQWQHTHRSTNQSRPTQPVYRHQILLFLISSRICPFIFQNATWWHTNERRMPPTLEYGQGLPYRVSRLFSLLWAHSRRDIFKRMLRSLQWRGNPTWPLQPKRLGWRWSFPRYT